MHSLPFYKNHELFQVDPKTLFKKEAISKFASTESGFISNTLL